VHHEDGAFDFALFTARLRKLEVLESHAWAKRYAAQSRLWAARELDRSGDQAGMRVLLDRNIISFGPLQHLVSNSDRRDAAAIASMMDSFSAYAANYMYVDSAMYPLVDKTNRHGITHGFYADADYGRPLNFYKTIAAVDFLTLVASFTTNSISGFAPSQTPESKTLARYYLSIGAFRKSDRPALPSGWRAAPARRDQHVVRRASSAPTWQAVASSSASMP
jgi:hypothetical protein